MKRLFKMLARASGDLGAGPPPSFANSITI